MVLPRSPAYELYIAFIVSLIPQAAALLLGGYGQVITNAPLAVVITIVDAVAVVIAYLQFRDDSHASRSSHWLVWATIAIGSVWLVYAVFVGIVVLRAPPHLDRIGAAGDLDHRHVARDAGEMSREPVRLDRRRRDDDA